ncbi:hypothetical protein KY290_004557 [Solanum tuberosum]|uniref:RNase H type-1 domain-containing protein n=1 Tax=Solanum tuberosum TaxID=4113 RepID=A0ABQ7WC43_SOLTU|nr:hypothetical protein KY290_004557 [Solanum tuberosum]
MIQYITENINPVLIETGRDKAWRMGNTTGNFTVKSAWDLLRHIRDEREILKFIWNKGIPLRINFFLWRVWKGRVPTDDNLQIMRINVPSRYWCCEQYKQETMEHLFLTASIATKLWKHFANFAGIVVEGKRLYHLMKVWWHTQAPSKVMNIYKVIPALITWTLWKRRNSRKYGGDISLQSMISQVLQNVQFILKKKFPWIEMRGQNWEEMIRRLNANKSRLYHCIVRWDAPHEDVIKCNTDGASKGNLGISAYGYCLRNSNDDLIHAAAENIGITTNVEAEMRVILEAIRYCVNKKMRKIILESDSLLMVKIINEAWKVPWVIAQEFNELK